MLRSLRSKPSAAPPTPPSAAMSDPPSDADLADAASKLLRRFVALVQPALDPGLAPGVNEAQVDVPPVDDWPAIYSSPNLPAPGSAFVPHAQNIAVRSLRAAPGAASQPHLFAVDSILLGPTAAQAWTLLAAAENRPVWDAGCEHAYVARWLPSAPHSQVHARVEVFDFAGIFMVAKPRDMALLTLDARLPAQDGRGPRLASVSTSIDHPPPKPKYARFTFGLGGFVVEPLEPVEINGQLVPRTRVQQINDLTASASWCPAPVVKIVSATIVPRSLARIAAVSAQIAVPSALGGKADGPIDGPSHADPDQDGQKHRHDAMSLASLSCPTEHLSCPAPGVTAKASWPAHRSWPALLPLSPRGGDSSASPTSVRENVHAENQPQKQQQKQQQEQGQEREQDQDQDQEQNSGRISASRAPSSTNLGPPSAAATAPVSGSVGKELAPSTLSTRSASSLVQPSVSITLGPPSKDADDSDVPVFATTFDPSPDRSATDPVATNLPATDPSTAGDTSADTSASRRRLRRVRGSRELRSHCSRPSLSSMSTDAGKAQSLRPLPSLVLTSDKEDKEDKENRRASQRLMVGHKRGLSALSLTPSETPSAQWARTKGNPTAQTSETLAMGHMAHSFGPSHLADPNTAGDLLHVPGGGVPLPNGPLALPMRGRRWARWPKQRLRFRIRGRPRARAAAVAALKRASQAAKVAVKAPGYAHTFLRACLAWAKPTTTNQRIPLPRGARPSSIPGAWPALEAEVAAAAS